MNIRIQIIVVVAAVASLVALVNLIRKNKLLLKYALLWLALGIGVCIFACFPSLTSYLAGLMGIYTPINMLFFAGFCFSLAIIFSLTVAISRLSQRVKKLSQEIALLKGAGKVNSIEGGREGALGYKVNSTEGGREGALGCKVNSTEDGKEDALGHRNQEGKTLTEGE